MWKPGDAKGTDENVLIWGASGSVGGYAVQYAKSVGYNVIATASPRSYDSVKALGASEVYNYKSADVVSQLKAAGPYKYVMTASGDPASHKAIGEILQPQGGKFVSVLPGQVELPGNVQAIYDAFSVSTQKPENSEFAKWWYQETLPCVIPEGKITPTPVKKIGGGLGAIQEATQIVLSGTVKEKIVLNPQE
jgi:NADPH:quinone reductase-like Zn-dependent oxidoreductase